MTRMTSSALVPTDSSNLVLPAIQGYTCLIKKKGLVKANPDRVETPKGEYGCVYMAEFAVALAVRSRVLDSPRPHSLAQPREQSFPPQLQAEIKPNDASLKAYKRIFAPEAPLPQHEPSTPLSMRFVKDRVQALLSKKTDLIVETGASPEEMVCICKHARAPPDVTRCSPPRVERKNNRRLVVPGPEHEAAPWLLV